MHVTNSRGQRIKKRLLFWARHHCVLLLLHRAAMQMHIRNCALTASACAPNACASAFNNNTARQPMTASRVQHKSLLRQACTGGVLVYVSLACQHNTLAIIHRHEALSLGAL